MNSKLLVLFTASLFLMGNVSASDHFEFPDVSTDYSKSPEIDIECDPSVEGESCPEGDIGPKIQVCGAIENDIEFIEYPDGTYHYFTEGIEIPTNEIDNNAACPIGKSSPIKMLDENLDVIAKGGSVRLYTNPAAVNLEVMMNTQALVFEPEGEEGDLVSFGLNDKTDEDNVEAGEIAALEYDSDKNYPVRGFDAKKNYVIDNNLESLAPAVAESEDIENCSTVTCKIIKKDFTTSNSQIFTNACITKSYSDGCPLGYESNQNYDGQFDYELKGEIVLGKLYYDGGPGTLGGEPKFLLCGDKESFEGLTAYSPGDNYEFDQFICNSQGEWENVAECDDGRDNDEDGKVDLEDPNCGNNPDTYSESLGECLPVIAEEGNNFDDKAALWNVDGANTKPYSPSFSDCTYSTIEFDEDYDRQPETFVCREMADPPYAYADNYEGPTPDEADNFCANRYASDGPFAQVPMPAVQYFVPKSVMPEGQSDWATERGFAPNYGFQTLHQAEGDYKSAGYTIHDFEGWDKKSMINLEGYDNDEKDKFIDAWDVANASAEHDDEVDGDKGVLSDEGVFKGGFHGECPENKKWVHNSIWRCGVNAVDQDIHADSYILDDLKDGTIPGSYAGFRINASELSKWVLAHPNAPAGGGASGVSPLTVRAQCWHGGNEERPSDLSNVANITEQVETDSNGDLKNLSAVAQIPERSTTPENKDTYSCVFGLRQQIDDTEVVLDKSSPLWYEGDQTTNTVGGAEIGYITEGNNQNGMVAIDPGAMEIPVPDSFDGSEQDWLKNRESEYIGSGTDPWQHFHIADGENPCLGTRHPYYYARNC